MIGTRVGPYEILAKLGAGGMGEVYRARDTKLQRDAALKFLPESLAADANRLGRFEREAQTLASLNHPNIAQVYGFESSPSGQSALAMELLDGETLTNLVSAGPLPIRKAIEYAVQIARGLAAAHDRGIIHRDLKPDNVIVLRDGHVKLIDFGLARESAPAASGMTAMQTIARTPTEPGMVMGTVGYMAPEQVRGEALDARADLFALGAVLYEMLAGRRAFARETTAETMTAILREDPDDLLAVRREVSPGLDRVVRHCLEKNRVERFQTARDVAFALETLSSISSSSAAMHVVAAPRKKPAWLPWVIAAVAVVGAAGWTVWKSQGEAREQPWDYFTRITESAGEETSPTLSADGTTVAYAAQVNGKSEIFAQRVGGRNASRIISDPEYDVGGPAFSPDGSMIAFHRSTALGGIFVAGATGESVRRLTDEGFEPAWSPDGTMIAYANEEIFDPASRQGESVLRVVDVAGGTPRKLLDEDGVQPAWSPSGERIAYWRNVGGQRDICTVAATGGVPVPVTNDPAIDWSPVWSPDGKYLYFSSDRGAAMNLWRVRIEQSTGRVLGTPEPVTTGVQAAAAFPRLSKDGSRLVFRSRVASVNPAAIPFDPTTLRAGVPVLLDTQNNVRIPSGVSPDGKQVAFFSMGEHQEDLFIGSPNGPLRRVTDDAARDRQPAFTPDGRSLIFYSTRGGGWGMWSIGTDGGDLRNIVSPPEQAVFTNVSPKGDLVAFTDDSSQRLFTAPLASTKGTATELPNVVVDGLYFNPTSWSPDGTRLAGLLNTSAGRISAVGVYDLRAHTTTLITQDPTFAVKWLADSRRVIYFTKSGRELVVLDTQTRNRTVVDVHLPGPSVGDTFAVSPDNRMVYYGAVRSEADIWIAERK